MPSSLVHRTWRTEPCTRTSSWLVGVPDHHRTAVHSGDHRVVALLQRWCSSPAPPYSPGTPTSNSSDFTKTPHNSTGTPSQREKRKYVLRAVFPFCPQAARPVRGGAGSFSRTVQATRLPTPSTNSPNLSIIMCAALIHTRKRSFYSNTMKPSCNGDN